MEKLIKEQLQDNFEVKIFGEPYSVLNLNLEKEDSPSIKQFGDSPSIVKVLGMKTLGSCIKLDRPRFILLPGNGGKPDDCGYEDNEAVKMWTLGKDFSSISIEMNPVSISDLDSTESINGVSISVRLKNAKYTNGVFTANIQVSVNIYGIEIPIPPIPIRVSITVGGSSTVYNDSFHIGDVKVTVKVKLKLRSANRACAVVEVNGKYGPLSVGDDEEVCVTF